MEINQLKSTLNHIKPPMWRRVEARRNQARQTAPRPAGRHGLDRDGWEQEIEVEKICRGEAPCTIRAVSRQTGLPPQDCGGPPGYEYLLEALADQKREHDSMIEWVGGEFDPEAFDLSEVNQALWRMRWKRSTLTFGASE